MANQPKADGTTTFDIKEEELKEGKTIPIDQTLKVVRVNVKKGKGGSGITLHLLDK
jgi:translation elongation factor P/translation initiation factor 5A